jgi:hypothetical protein
MQVALSRRDAGVTHGGLHGREVEAAGDQQRAIRMAEIVEAQRAEPGRVAGALDTAAQS